MSVNAKGSGYGLNLMDVSVVVLISCSSKSVKPGLTVKNIRETHLLNSFPLASLNHSNQLKCVHQ